MTDSRPSDAVVIGGGLGGLAAATYLARAGRTVTLFERSRALGGRGMTQSASGFRFNIGPHALYRRAEAAGVLAELGIQYRGGIPKTSGNYAIHHGTKQTLPTGLVSLLTTGLMRLPAKLEAGRLLAAIPRIDAESLQRTTVSDWLETNVRQPDVRALVQALVRLTTYANDPERQSAGSALRQIQLALSGGVTYLDGGWQTLVDGLRNAAQESGVSIVTGARVESVEHDGAVRAVRLADGTRHATRAAIIAGLPSEARSLLADTPSAPVHAWAEAAIPVKAACLDVGLSRLPQPRATFALGIDRPLYLSVHSAVAWLAPGDGATIHVAKYLPTDGHDDSKSERELESVLDLVQPGWRELIVERRFLPNMLVYGALVTAQAGGASERPGPAVPGIRNLCVVGDWVGPEGLLLDASLASARRAAGLIAQADGPRAVKAA